MNSEKEKTKKRMSRCDSILLPDRLRTARGETRYRSQQLPELRAHEAVRFGAEVAAQLHDDVVGAELRERAAERFANEAFRSIAIDCTRRDLAGGNDAKPRMRTLVHEGPQHEVTTGEAIAGPQHRFELGRPPHRACRARCARALIAPAFMPACRMSGGAAFAQTASRALPFALRALMTARPAFVFMRTRKPCVRLRRVFDG